MEHRVRVVQRFDVPAPTRMLNAWLGMELCLVFSEGKTLTSFLELQPRSLRPFYRIYHFLFARPVEVFFCVEANSTWQSLEQQGEDVVEWWKAHERLLHGDGKVLYLPQSSCELCRPDKPSASATAVLISAEDHVKQLRAMVIGEKAVERLILKKMVSGLSRNEAAKSAIEDLLDDLNRSGS